MVAEHDGGGDIFHLVVFRRRGAVRVDVVDLLGLMPASASVLRMQPMIGLPSGLERVRWKEFGQFAAAGDDAEDRGAARDRGLIAFQHQRAGAFGHDEAVAVLRERF